MSIYLSFENTVLSPEGVNANSNKERSVVNSIAIATESSWEDVVKSLIEQVHIKSRMPSYNTCITDMIKANGFVPVKYTGAVMDMYFDNYELFSQRRKFIIRIYNRFFAVVPKKDTKDYIIRGAAPEDIPVFKCQIHQMWLYEPGTDNRTGINRQSKKKAMQENNNYIAENMNPKGVFVGDCVIRALSLAYGCTWDEAIDHIVFLSDYRDPTINSPKTFEIALEKLGFKRYSPIRKNNVFLTGKEFCENMDGKYSNGERIFAYVGKHHCAAVVPTKTTNGECKYMIHDTWDSTTRNVYAYWVYKPQDL